MGSNLTHTVSGNVASFRSADVTDIESLKIHFLPIYEGSGDASPENIRNIVGWNQVEMYRTFNLWDGQYELGGIDNSGQETTNTSVRRNVGYIPVQPSSKISVMYTKHPNNTYNIQIFQYKNDKTFNNRSTWIAPNGTYNMQSDTYYIRIYMDGNYSSIYTEGDLVIFDSTQKTTLPITFPTFTKNKWNDNDGKRSRTNMSQNNYVYSNSQVDTRDVPQFYLAAYNNNTSLGTIGTLYVTTLGRNSMTVTIPECTHLYFKHNGNLRDFGVKMPFTEQPGIYTLSFTLNSNDPTTVGGLIFSDIQLESGETATEYEPYNVINGNVSYGGYIDVAEGEFVVNYYKYTFDGTESNWSLDGSGDNTRRVYIDTFRLGPVAKAKGKLYCNYCSNKSGQWYGWLSSTGSYGSCHALFYVPATIDTVEKWCTYLSEHPLDICYEINQPIHYQISKQQIKTLLNYNNMWSNTNSTIEVTYEIIDHLNDKRVSLNTPHVNIATGQLISFNTDMNTSLKEAKLYFNPIQNGSGDASPSNIRTISGQTGLILKKCGKNLLDPDTKYPGTATYTSNGITFNLNNDGSVSITGKIADNTISGPQFRFYWTPYISGNYYFTSNSSFPAANIETYMYDQNTSARCRQWDGVSNGLSSSSSRKLCEAQLVAGHWTGLNIRVNRDVDYTYTGETLYPMILAPTCTDTTFESYIGTTTSIQFPAVGKNLLDPAYRNDEYNNNIIYNRENRTSLKAGTYTLSTSTSNVSIYVYQGPNGSQTALFVKYNTNFLTFTLNNDTDDLWFNFYTGDGIDHTATCQLECGNSVTSYEPYGTLYGGYIDLLTGEIYKTHEVIDCSILNWTSTTTSGHKVLYADTNIQGNINATAICENYKFNDKKNVVYLDEDEFCAYSTSSCAYRLGLRDSSYDECTRAQIQAALTGVKIVCQLLTPVLIATLTPIQLKSFIGQNNIWTSAGGNNIIKYWTH